MKAYLEKVNNEWLDDFVYISRYPLENMGFDIISFDGNDFCDNLIKFNFTKDDIMIGSVESTVKFFNFLNIKIPEYIGYPKELSKYYNRNIELIFFKDLKNDFPYFIKPAKEIKLFTGDIISNKNSINFLKDFYDVKNDTLLYKSNIIDIDSEYRCFVFKNELKGIQFYNGDFKLYPNIDIINNIIKDYKNPNVAYTLDVGINNKKDTFLIEINDMWAIGSYGFNSKLYTKMCVHRMREIIKNIKF